MTQPEKPKSHPTTPTAAPTVLPKDKPGGVPQGATEADAKGAPNSDRQDSETAGKS